MQTQTVKMRAKGYRHEVTEVEHNGRLYFRFGYSKALMEEIKALEGARWEGPIGEEPGKCPPEVAKALGGAKAWSVPICQHNLFQLEYLKGGDPYKWYDRPLIEHEIKARPNGIIPFTHQRELTNFFLTARHCVASAEQGVGKSLAVICAIEILKSTGPIWWVSSKSGVAAVRRELRIWGANFQPNLMTYEAMLKAVKIHQETGIGVIPQIIILDEAHKVKTHTAQRSQAAAFIADAIRDKYGKDSLIILMTGTPAPKAPTDWWHLCRIACPGFLREGTWEKFRNRLGIVVARENQTTGGMFPQLVSWKDDDNKCAVCGKPKETHDIHLTPEDVLTAHPFQPAVNEVTKLFKRMNGLVIRKFKKDCLDLPDMQYRQIICKPTPDMLRAAKLIAARSRRVIEKITLLRELSDGFQYQEVKGEEIKCECNNGKILDWVEKEEGSEEFEEREVDCYICEGSGKTHRIIREAKYVPTPKEQAFRDQLELHEDCGRLVAYAGFTGSIDRIVEIAKSEKWATIKWDGRGITCTDAKGLIIRSDPLTMFQDMLEEHPRVCFIGHPESSGEGITLTRSPTIVFYSNDFNFKSRDQAEARIHRLGMDINRGATIVDLICLETDRMILENLKAKKRLQTMTLTGLTFEEQNDKLFDYD